MCGHSPNLLIAGPSASGKSSVAEMAATELGIECFSLDEYFISGSRRFVETAAGKVRNYEAPELYNGAQLAKDVIARGPCVVEGFCLFSYPEMLALPGQRFFIDVPFQTCLARRRARKPSRPSDRSFEVIGEAETLRVVEPQRHLPGMTVVDGRLPIQSVLELVMRQYRSATG